MKKHLTFMFVFIALGLYANIFTQSNDIELSLKKISLSETGIQKTDKIFAPGQTVWISLRVSGLEKDDRNDVMFVSDLFLSGKGGRVVLEKKNILNQKLHAGKIVPVVTATYNIELYHNIRAERYTVNIVMMDMISRKYNTFSTWFEVKK